MSSSIDKDPKLGKFTIIPLGVEVHDNPQSVMESMGSEILEKEFYVAQILGVRRKKPDTKIISLDEARADRNNGTERKPYSA